MNMKPHGNGKYWSMENIEIGIIVNNCYKKIK